ncbi:beta-glucosidase 47 [Hibiscus trionum]|uniref:Beta-glucosidase 47 n=1 Tax=Hibiscus trionum TaxID=183268 RepID=A0A9W7JCV1_HIBTR|nr:beta-glucosidase 47 [Hibiscus trionum]
MGYVKGLYPPARCSQPFGNCSAGNSDKEPFIVVHNMLLAHAKAVKRYREQFQRKQGGSIGIVAHTHMYEPLRHVESDHQAVNRLLAFKAGWIFDPLVFGDYPPEMRQFHRSELPRFSTEETECLKGSIDFIGINHYSTLYAKDCIHSHCPSGGDHRFIKGFAYTTGERNGIPIGDPTGVGSFFVVPRGMEKIVDYVSKRYKNMPIYVTENGYSPPQAVPNSVHDVNRIEFHKGYLAALARAIRKGADVRGYFIWSLMDNFEWAGGYSSRFGLYHVDRATMERVPKLSAKWFRHFLANRRTMIAGTGANATVM